jgi:hypothetical protein
MRTLSCLLLAAVAVGVAGCSATQQETTIVPLPREDVVRVPTGDATADVRLQREDFIARADLDAPRAAVWEALPAVFTEIGLPQPVMDRTRWIAIVDQYTLTRTLGKQPLSRFLSCGHGMSGEHADTRRIRLTVRTTLQSSTPDRTVVLTRVEAVAHAIDGTSTAPTECTSRGPIENMIASGLRSRVAGGPDR